MKLALFSKFLLFFITTQSFSQEHLFSSLTIPERLTQNANAVIRRNEVSITLESRKKLTVVERRVVTVLNEIGNAAVQAYSGYDKYVKIKKIEAVVYNASGAQIKKIKKKDFIDHSAVDGGTLYSDSRVLFMGYTPVSYPYTVEFLCEVETSNTAGIPTWRPITDYYISIEKDVYSLTDNAGLGLRFKEKKLDGFNIAKTNTENSLKYVLEDTRAIKPEDLSPSFSKFTPQVLIAVDDFHFYGVDGSAKNWVEFGDWINNALLEGKNVVTDETKQKVLNLTKGVEDPIERAKKVFEFVQKNTRYISVQVGIGGVQPISALEVDQLKYGDCKGLTNYTQALLAIANVPSYYCVVQAGNEIVDFEDDFASLEQGNHIILAIPNNDELIWLDCTSQIHPFNFIGDFTDNRKVLVVKPESSEILKTTTYQDSLNFQSINASIKLNDDGSMDSKVDILTRGVPYDNSFFLERQDRRDVIDYYKERWGYVNNLEVSKYNFENDKSKIQFTQSLDLKARDYVSFNGDRLLFHLNAFNRNRFVPDRYSSRKLPLRIDRGYLDKDKFEFQIPEGYKIEAVPENRSIQNKFGEYNIQIESNGEKIVFKRKLLIKNGEYPKNQYAAYRDFRKQVSRGDNAKIVLIKAN